MEKNPLVIAFNRLKKKIIGTSKFLMENDGILLRSITMVQNQVEKIGNVLHN